MNNKVDLEDVYLEYPDSLENVENKKEKNKKAEHKDTAKMSLDELLKKLEETQSLRL